MKNFNELLKFPWGTINTISNINPYVRGTYYSTLYELLTNGRDWERKGQKPEPQVQVQPQFAASSSLSAMLPAADQAIPMDEDTIAPTREAQTGATLPPQMGI